MPVGPLKVNVVSLKELILTEVKHREINYINSVATGQLCIPDSWSGIDKVFFFSRIFKVSDVISNGKTGSFVSS